MANGEAPATVKSAMRTLDILEFLIGQRRPLAAHELSTALAIPVSSLSYLLSTLVERGYLLRDGRRYAPGPALALLNPDQAMPSVADRAAPLVRAISTQLNETATFFVRRGDEIEAVATAIGTQPLRYALDIGQHAPLHAFAAGKALLAALPEDELDAYFKRTERRAYTHNTIIEEGRMRAELAIVRETGIARTTEEHTPGIIGIGRAAMHDGVLAGAFSVAIPVARFDAKADQAAVTALKRATGVLAGSGED